VSVCVRVRACVMQVNRDNLIITQFLKKSFASFAKIKFKITNQSIVAESLAHAHTKSFQPSIYGKVFLQGQIQVDLQQRHCF